MSNAHDVVRSPPTGQSELEQFEAISAPQESRTAQLGSQSIPIITTQGSQAPSPPPRSEPDPSDAKGNSSLHVSPYLLYRQIGTQWREVGSLKNLVVFGDSYSSSLTGYDGDEEDNDDDDLNTTWVDFFVSSLSSTSPTSVVLNNFAFPGATVYDHLGIQLAQFFDQFPKGAQSEETTFVFFLGINDCGGIRRNSPSSLVNKLFDAIHHLYINAGARNFLLVDVPPTDRSPMCVRSFGLRVELADRIKVWNDELVARASNCFPAAAATATTPDADPDPDASMFVLSFNKILSEILDNPSEYGFDENAVGVEGRGIWRDSLHLTAAVHMVIASYMHSALGLDGV